VTIHFPDYSHYQDGHSLTGAVALIAKGTEGTSFTDPSYRDFKTRSAARGIPFMGYHWINTTSIADQAAHAYSVMPDVPVMWDAEALGVTVPRLVELTNRFRDLGGDPRAFYLPAWWWHDHMGAPDLRPLERLGLYLISSNYPSAGYSDNGAGWVAYGGVAPKQWQYTSTPVDLNAFKGSVDDLRRLWGLEDGMSAAQEYVQHVMNYRLEAVKAMRDPINIPAFKSSDGSLVKPALTEPNELAKAIRAIGAGGQHTHETGPAKPTV
jgi:hypothetical protein